MTNFEPTPRTKVNRIPARGRYERELVYQILDEALLCHVGFVVDGQPFVIPTAHWRQGNNLYLHGSPASRMLRAISGGIPVSVNVTLLDGLVLARSAFHHSMNYRSVVILGRATVVEDAAHKLAALEAFVEHVVPGRLGHIRRPEPKEVQATTVLEIPLLEVSAKVRTGGPLDEERDMGLPVWAGVLPLSLVPGEPLRDPKLPPEIAIPAHVKFQRIANG